jgi:hypothetical protein
VQLFFAASLQPGSESIPGAGLGKRGGDCWKGGTEPLGALMLGVFPQVLSLGIHGWRRS